MSSNNFNLRRVLSMCLASAIMSTSVSAGAFAASITDYEDVDDSHWAYDALSWAVDNGVMNGTSDDTMSPDEHLTRSEMAAMIDRLYGTYKGADISAYTDVVTGSWYYDYIAQAVNMGTLVGLSDSQMDPDANITREQAMVVIARTLCLMAAANEDLSQFPDADQIGSWAYSDVYQMVEREFVAGYPDGTLSPKADITRAEMAQILARIFSHIYESGTLTGEYDDIVLVRGSADIHDAVFNGDLIIANGLKEGTLTLTNVTVKGRLIVWGGSTVYVNGASSVSGVVTPRNDGDVQVIFDAVSTILSKANCDVVYPASMDPENEVIWTETQPGSETTEPDTEEGDTDSEPDTSDSESSKPSSGNTGGGGGSSSGGVVVKKPGISFTLPTYLYEGDSAVVTPILTNTTSVEWTLTKDGVEQDVTGLTREGGTLTFTQPGTYTLKGVATRGSYANTCEQTVTVLPVIDMGFSLPQYAHTDETTEVDLRFEDEADGTVVWALTKDGAAYPMPAGFDNDGGTLALTEPGTYVLTATYTDAAGAVYQESQTIIILPVIVLDISVDPNETHIDVAATVTANDTNLPVQWTISQNGDELEWDSVTASVLGATGGELLIPTVGDYTLMASVTDVAGRVFTSNVESITIEGLIDLELEVPQYSWTDRAPLIELAGYEDYPVVWEVLDAQNEPVSYAGTLHDDGGNIQIYTPGIYTIKATVTDRLGREFSAQDTIEILPVIELSAEVEAEQTAADVPSVAGLNIAADKASLHLDETLELILQALNATSENEITWDVAKGGVLYEGLNLTDLAAISFTEAGDYTFIARTADKAGRDYESNEVSAHVIENLDVTLTASEQALHEDETVDITLSVAKGDPIDIAWTLTFNGDEIPVQLDEAGGQLSFAEYGDGEYVLTAAVTDELGKVFTQETTIDVYPVIELAIEAPENIHIDRTAEITLTGNDLDGLQVNWNVLSEAGGAVIQDLDNDGGTLDFTEAGVHFISASVEDALGRVFTAESQTILVWETVQLSFKLPAFSHPDETVVVKMTSENLRDNQIDWSLTVDGTPVALTTGVDGSLTNDGGSVKFTQPGTNVLTATVVDELGRTFTYEQTIEVYPILTLDLTATAALHTDEIIDVDLTTNTSLPISWTVTPSNDPDTATTYDGTLTDEGGMIQIDVAGTYDIAASVQDATGRVFTSATQSVKVYPVAGLTFTLPATAWTDSAIPVDLLTSDLTDRNVTWTLTKDGAAARMQDYVFGSLNDKGGNIRFTAVGTYTLTASATDELGREYTHTETITIYPVIALNVDVPDSAYTDEAIDVTLTKTNWDGQNVYWTVLRDGTEIAPIFELTEDGGHGFLTEPGLYTFIARTTDELGRESTSSDTIQIYPVGVAGFYLPTAFHTDEEVTLITDFQELGENVLYWSLYRNGELVQPAEVMYGDLNADGGQLQFRLEGDYTLKAVFSDGGGRVYSYEQDFTVYPIPEVSWTLPAYGHTDTELTVPVKSVNVSGVDGTTIQWFIDDTYGLRQNWATYVDGTLTAEPGTIRIKHAGIYTLTCEVTDATGRVFSFDGPSIEILAEQELNVEITEDEVYVGYDAEVLTLGNNNTLPIKWTLAKDGVNVDIDDYVIGDLNNYGGSIQFTEAGRYELIGTMTDGLGRTFSDSDFITVLPVGSLSFSMSSMEYVGNQVTVIMDSIVNPTNADVQWSVEKDGNAYAMSLPGLNNNGGVVTFTEVGDYTLIATLDDGSGSPSTCRRDIEIIYKADLAITAPATIHIGDSFLVSLSGSGTLDVKWGVKKGNQPVTLDANTGLLSGTAGTLTLYETGTYTITATALDDAGNPHTTFTTVEVTNTAPSIDSFIANATRTVQDGCYYAELSATASDPDGDAVYLEWDDAYEDDGWYTIGTHTIRVRAVDEWGATSAWESRTIEFVNSAPTITSLVANPSSTPTGTQFYVAVSADATDPDGDDWTLEWGGDYQASGYYDPGTWTIRVRAVDEYGAASAWKEKTFEIVENLSLTISAPYSVETNESFTVSLSGAGSYPVTWKITDPNGDVVTGYSLSSTGGTLSFPTAGTYTIKASITGVTGATATASANVAVTSQSAIFTGTYSMNLYWDNNGNDMDSHMYFYDASGTQIGHLYYANRSVCGCSLDRDDTSGGTGEWLTLDFDEIPDEVNKITVSIYGFRGDATVWMILRQERVIVDSSGNQTTQVLEPVRLDTYITNHETVSFGYFLRNGDTWDFYGYDGTIVRGSGTE